jgi:hypothetical protein
MMMTDTPLTPLSSLAVAAAAFVARALGLDDPPATIAAELATVKEAGHAAIYSIEVDSSIGQAAFLVYVYVLDATDAEGVTGADRYEDGMGALQQAADRDTPGPRMVAHTTTDAMAFILATTPATWRLLQGEGSTLVATEADLPAVGISPEQRATIAEDLHKALKSAGDHAREWLAAIQAAGDDADFTEAETALALFVLDQANVQPTLTALNFLVNRAREQAGRIPAAEGESRSGTSPR